MQLRSIDRIFSVVALGVALAALCCCALRPPVARANPGFEQMGRAINLGVDAEQRPVTAVYRGQTYAAMIVAQPGRQEVVVDRFVPDGGSQDPRAGHWERVRILNGDLRDRVSNPRLLSSVDPRTGRPVLDATWIENGALMIARLDEDNWRRSAPGPSLDSYMRYSLVTLGGWPCVVTYSHGIAAISVLAHDRWYRTPLADVLPPGASYTGGAAAYGDTLFVGYRDQPRYVAAHQDSTGNRIPAHIDLDFGLGRVRFDGEGRFTRAGTIPLVHHELDAASTSIDLRLVVADQPGARPLVAWSVGPRTTLAEVTAAERAEEVGSVLTNGANREAHVEGAARLGSTFGLLVTVSLGTPDRLILYRIQGRPGDRFIEAEPVPQAVAAGSTFLSLVAGPADQPLISLQRGNRALVLAFTPDSG